MRPGSDRHGVDQLYNGAVRVFASIILVFGVATVAITVANGGGPLSVGAVIGTGFIALGGARLWLALRS